MKELENSSLQEVVRIAKEKGYKVYTFESSSIDISQVFIEDTENKRIGSASAYFGGIRFSTIHKPYKGAGSGFGELIKGQDFNNPKDLDICFINYPNWVSMSTIIKKYPSFEEYVNDSLGILKYYEI